MSSESAKGSVGMVILIAIVVGVVGAFAIVGIARLLDVSIPPAVTGGIIGGLVGGVAVPMMRSKS